MNILMLTNVYTPQIGGVTRSIQQFSEEFRNRGHKVLVMAPEYQEKPDPDEHVIRVPAIPNFYEGKYSLPIPVISRYLPELRSFQPDIIHSHHPFLLGSTAQSVAAEFNAPLVYTYHTRYSVYIETKTNWPHSIEEAILELITGYCELSDAIISPSEGMRELLRKRGIDGRIEVISTGVNLQKFSQGDGSRFRAKHGMDEKAFIVGHCGRLSVEKNCLFLVHALGEFLQKNRDGRLLVVGDGPERATFQKKLEEYGVADQAVLTGFLEGQDLVDAYHAMDVFAFTSHSETQGMVLSEAMAAGTPVVAVSATGVDDIVEDGRNGFLIPRDDQNSFVEALTRVAGLSIEERSQFQQNARATAEEVSQDQCAEKMLSLYADLIELKGAVDRGEESAWYRLNKKWDVAWQIWKSRTRAAATLVRESVTPTE